MAVVVDQKDGIAVVRMPKELTLGVGDEFKSTLVDLASSNQVKVVLDMTRLEFVDSAGLGLLIWALKNFRQRKGDVRVFGTQPSVYQLFDITNMDRVFLMFDNEEDALQSFAEG